MIFYLACIVLTNYSRFKLDGRNIFSAFTISFFANLMIEAIAYMNMKAKASLFLRIKFMSLQEEQLKNLLDTVPDHVLICSQDKEGHAPKSIFGNR